MQLNVGNGQGGGGMMPMMVSARMAKADAVQESAPGETEIRLQVGGQIQVQGLE